MLHFAGDVLALELGESAKRYIWIYYKSGETCLVPFMDIKKGKKRFVKFEKLAGQWVFVDLVD